MSRALANYLGTKAEEWAEEERGVACVNGTVDGFRLGEDPYQEPEYNDTEVKGCVRAYESGRVGRLRFWRRQHELLEERDGSYLIIVYEPDAQEPVQLDRWVHWSSLDAIMERVGYSWYDAREHGMRSKQTQVPWSRFFPEITE